MKVENWPPHILFVYPPATLSPKKNVSAHFNICLGSAYCISYLVQNGFIARQFFTEEPINVGQCAARILSEKPRAVGFTVYNTNYCFCRLIANALKKAAPNIVIFFGGPTASVCSETILKTTDSVDICVRHEGEETCLELMSTLDETNFDLKKASLEKIKGISYRLEDNILENPERDILLENRKIPNFLDKYPSPYLTGILNSSSPGIITARGCNHHCVYCNCAIISKRMITTHSTDRVIEELDYISRRINYDSAIDIFDDAFTLLPDRALEICSKIIENKIKLPLGCATRCDKVNEELLEKMKEAGFKYIGFSLESAVPRILRVIGKIQNPKTKGDDNFEKEKKFIEKFKKYTSYAKKIGINYVFASIMIGLPAETLEEGQQTVNLIRSLEEKIDHYAHNIFKVFPGTPIFFNCEKYGIKLLKYDDQVQYKTIYTYDTNKIKPAPKSNLESDSISQDKSNIKSLALSLRKKIDLNYFNKIILCADFISSELILWLQKYLAVNGPFIQIYSNVNRAKHYYNENEQTLIKYNSPTKHYTGYYQKDRKNGNITLVPFRTYLIAKQCGININILNTKAGLLFSHTKINPLHSLCIDRKKEDALQLYHLLVNLSDEDRAVKNLFDSPIYPYISSLCRWEKSLANCITLDTIFVDSDNNIKTCWNGVPIGKVGMPFDEIVENLRNIHCTTAAKRNCRNCNRETECTKCIFPRPLSENEYCDLKRNFNTWKSADLIRTFDIFKGL